jgi:hypothetical protein
MLRMLEYVGEHPVIKLNGFDSCNHVNLFFSFLFLFILFYFWELFFCSGGEKLLLQGLMFQYKWMFLQKK